MIKWLPYLFLFPVAFIGAVGSSWAERSPAWSLALILLTANLSGLLWWWVCKIHAISYAISSILYNLFYEGTYFVALIMLAREKITVAQFIGVILALIAGWLMGK